MASPINGQPTSDSRATEQPGSKEKILEAIQEAATTYDPSFLESIAPHLRSSDAEIRLAAAEGIVLLGDKSGSALLREAAETTRNPSEAAEMNLKADYLDLPPATPDFLRQMRAIREQQTTGQQRPAPRE